MTADLPWVECRRCGFNEPVCSCSCGDVVDGVVTAPPCGWAEPDLCERCDLADDIDDDVDDPPGCEDCESLVDDLLCDRHGTVDAWPYWGCADPDCSCSDDEPEPVRRPIETVHATGGLL